jgi:hypothetical protein
MKLEHHRCSSRPAPAAVRELGRWTEWHAMRRAFIVLALSCASVLGADMGIRVVTTTKTNTETASVYIKDVFTRDGLTNLVRNTKLKAGAVQIRIHRFYHGGQLVGDFVATADSSGFTSEAGSPYSVSFEFWPSREVRSAVIGTKDGVVLDAFTCTNGIFSPVESSVIQKANAIGADMKQLFDPEHVRKTSPEEFLREAEDLVQKHKDK